jgi:hypothetical protein
MQVQKLTPAVETVHAAPQPEQAAQEEMQLETHTQLMVHQLDILSFTRTHTQTHTHMQIHMHMHHI